MAPRQMAELLDPGRSGRRADADSVGEQVGQREASSDHALRQFDQDAETQGRQGEVGPATPGRHGEGEKGDDVEGRQMRGRVAQTKPRLQALERTDRENEEPPDGDNRDGAQEQYGAVRGKQDRGLSKKAFV